MIDLIIWTAFLSYAVTIQLAAGINPVLTVILFSTYLSRFIVHIVYFALGFSMARICAFALCIAALYLAFPSILYCIASLLQVPQVSLIVPLLPASASLLACVYSIYVTAIIVPSHINGLFENISLLQTLVADRITFSTIYEEALNSSGYTYPEQPGVDQKTYVRH